MLLSVNQNLYLYLFPSLSTFSYSLFTCFLRNKIKDPRYYKAYSDELQKRFRSVQNSLSCRTVSKDAKANGYKKGEADEIQKMDHLFLLR